MRKLFKFIVAVLFLGFIVIITTGVIIFSYGKNAVPEKSDCMIILGCRLYGSTPSPFLIGRLDKGVQLYNNGYGKYIIVSGGRGSGESVTEADAMKLYLSEKGVPADKIILEDKSVSTMTNIANSSKVMKDNGMKTAVIVSNKYHLKRAVLMAQKCSITPTASGVFMAKYPVDEVFGFLREILALLKFFVLGN